MGVCRTRVCSDGHNDEWKGEEFIKFRWVS